jgi:hypothetical protein
MALPAKGCASDLANARPRLARQQRASDFAARTSGPADWVLLPEGSLSGDPAGSLALGLAPAGALNGNEQAQAKATEVFRAVLEPILSPGRYPDLHRIYPTRSELVQHLAEEHGMSGRSVYRLLARYQKDGIGGLVRKIRLNQGQSLKLNVASKNFLLAALLPELGVRGVLSNRDIWRLYQEELIWRGGHASKPLDQADRSKYGAYLDPEGRFLPSAQLSGASFATLCRQIARIPELVKLMARRGEDAYRNAELISFRDFSALQPLDYVVMDHRLLDIFCLIPDRRGWKLARPWLTAAIDMRTRKWLGWCIVETPSSDSIATVLKSVFIDYGLPRAVLWDNGKDFRSYWLEGRHERTMIGAAIDGLPTRWAGVMETLGIRVHHAIVKNARAKLIEPNFGRVADFDRTLPEFCGHRPGTRPEQFEKMLEDHEAWLKGKLAAPPFRTIEEIAALYDMALEDLNERELQGEGMRKITPTGRGWMTPGEVWELLIPRVERRTVPAEVLQLVFCKRRELTVRGGTIWLVFGGCPYRYRLTENRMALLGLNGCKVQLAYDPLDLGQAAVYYQDRFIGLGNCIELRRMGEDAFVQDERDRRAARREVKGFIKRVHQSVPVPTPETYLSRRRAVAPERPEPERVEVATPLPAQIQDARAALRAERAFSFEKADASISTVNKAVEPDAGDEFHFFSVGG